MSEQELLTIKQESEWADSKERLYFVRFEFICGEYEQAFGKAFYAKDGDDLEAKVDEYLENYYGKNSASEVDSDAYYYWGGEVGVRCVGWSEIKNFNELISELL